MTLFLTSNSDAFFTYDVHHLIASFTFLEGVRERMAPFSRFFRKLKEVFRWVPTVPVWCWRIDDRAEGLYLAAVTLQHDAVNPKAVDLQPGKQYPSWKREEGTTRRTGPGSLVEHLGILPALEW